MRVVRLILLGPFLLALSACSANSTDTKSGKGGGDGEGAKLVGSWKCVTEGADLGITEKDVIVDFEQDGRLKSNLGSRSQQGVYSVHGKELTVTLGKLYPQVGGTESKFTIEELTDSGLMIKDEKGKESRFEKRNR